MFDWLKSAFGRKVEPKFDVPVALPTPVAVLAPEELMKINRARALIADRAFEAELMAAGLNAFWWQMRKKYDFGPDITFTPTTGEIFEKSDGG